ncbi:MAG: RNA polymerase sigma-54 factor, partial [Muribaculaceae bacterium]|nr:RNA polymerase sigma-54 factor [Muribaculaceae bacterium]
MTKEGLQMEQTQQTVQRLSHRQVMFVRILEMNGPELEDEVRRQLDDNPALEVADSYESETDYNDSGSDSVEVDYMDDYQDDDPADYLIGKSMSGASDNNYQSVQIADDTPDLYDLLQRQLGEIEMPKLIRQIAQYIIGNIDENGWITRTLSEIADDIEFSTGMEVTHEQMREAFAAVRNLDPAGVGAVDLRDCLLLQLRRIRPKTLIVKIAESIVDEYFDLFSKRHYDRLCAYLGISQDEFEQALKFIRTLNPKPGSAIAVSQTSLKLNQITPDVAVDINDQGEASVTLISTLPALQIEKHFKVDSTPTSDSASQALLNTQLKAQTFVRHKRDEAEDFINALKQRSNTLVKVTEAIVSMQPDFFKSGDISKIRPMILKDIEARTG